MPDPRDPTLPTPTTGSSCTDLPGHRRPRPGTPPPGTAVGTHQQQDPDDNDDEENRGDSEPEPGSPRPPGSWGAPCPGPQGSLGAGSPLSHGVGSAPRPPLRCSILNTEEPLAMLDVATAASGPLAELPRIGVAARKAPSFTPAGDGVKQRQSKKHCALVRPKLWVKAPDPASFSGHLRLLLVNPELPSSLPAPAAVPRPHPPPGCRCNPSRFAT
ncbi:hypothetical protein P7K49_027564 [Saguinus oedipus]|uniref:Uncharacterized protein n=1 Tax=Saguinus oedipus TaxID=9490 RepID=A0ABQ9U9Y6_SAGOE|nr:hypothetical protein P7K49_027564 [Saguinus oedipus]